MEFNLDIEKVVGNMVQASSNSLIKGGRQAVEFAAHEYAQFIRDIEYIQTMAEKGTITDETAQALVEQHKFSMQEVLLAVEGLGLITVQNAINAALQVLNGVLTASLGTAFKFAL